MRAPGPEHVLLIDDYELSRAVLELHLAAAGYRVTEAESGEAAVDLLRTKADEIDVVLSDLQMPGLHGPELAEQLRRVMGTAVPLLAMSGSQPDTERYAGFDGFLLKPFTPEQFAQAIEGLLDGATSAKEAEAQAIAVLDETTFAKLQSMMSAAQLSEIFALSLAELTKYREQMQAAFDAGDGPALQASAHAMKGGFSILGAEELRSLGAMLEAGTGTATDQAATLGEIPLAAERLRRMLTSRGLAI